MIFHEFPINVSQGFETPAAPPDLRTRSADASWKPPEQSARAETGHLTGGLYQMPCRATFPLIGVPNCRCISARLKNFVAKNPYIMSPMI